MRNRWMISLAIAGLALGVGCDDEGENETAFGEYVISVSESRDTCDGTPNDFGSTLAVTSADGQIEVGFGGFPPISGTLGPEGALSAQGVVEETEDGTTVLQLSEVLFFRGGAVEGEGTLTLDGTFPDPDVTEPCQQDFNFSGEKTSASRAPALPTGPESR